MPGSDILCQTRNWGRTQKKTIMERRKQVTNVFGVIPGTGWPFGWQLTILVSWKLYNLVGINAH